MRGTDHERISERYSRHDWIDLPVLTVRGLLALLALVALAASPARAHAFLDHAIPAVGSSLQRVPAIASLWFTQELEPAFSAVSVVDRSGARIDAADAAVDTKDATLLHASLRPLPPATYKVIRRVVSLDTHTTEGTFTFRLGG
jgi:methionine-rich copper-binding protein CopC